MDRSYRSLRNVCLIENKVIAKQIFIYLKSFKKQLLLIKVTFFFLFFVQYRCELIDIKPGKGDLIGPILFKFVREYFDEKSKYGHTHIHPIYLQHNGHSRTIIGIETGGKSENLLLFDPSTRKMKIDQFKESSVKSKPIMQVFRRGLSAFNKNDAYQLVLIRGLISSDDYDVSFKIV